MTGNPDGPIALRCRIRGRVQGVFFRASTARRARDLGLSGYVKNLPDGSVEAVFCGPRERCAQALEFVRVGPAAARVDAVDTEWGVDDPVTNGFEIR